MFGLFKKKAVEPPQMTTEEAKSLIGKFLQVCDSVSESKHTFLSPEWLPDEPAEVLKALKVYCRSEVANGKVSAFEVYGGVASSLAYFMELPNLDAASYANSHIKEADSTELEAHGLAVKEHARLDALIKEDWQAFVLNTSVVSDGRFLPQTDWKLDLEGAGKKVNALAKALETGGLYHPISSIGSRRDIVRSLALEYVFKTKQTEADWNLYVGGAHRLPNFIPDGQVAAANVRITQATEAEYAVFSYHVQRGPFYMGYWHNMLLFAAKHLETKYALPPR